MRSTRSSYTAGRVRSNWERIKREHEGREGVFHDVPETLPALLYARKAQRRAAAVGFEYPAVAGALADLDRELDELRAELPAAEPAAETEPDARVAAELGDTLFAVVNVARRLNVDPELELRRATARFRHRIERAEELAAADGHDWTRLPLEEQDRYFDEAKEGREGARAGWAPMPSSGSRSRRRRPAPPRPALHSSGTWAATRR